MIPPIARRFVAGETAEAAVEHTRECNQRGVATILNLLGEHYDEEAAAAEDARAYVDLLSAVADADLGACVSVKPSQLGLGLGEAVFREHLALIVDEARDRGRFVWLDMEDHRTTDATLDAFEHHASRGDDVGVCVQANLRRTRADLERLAALPGKVRLVKGAYDEPRSIAYQHRTRVDEAYRNHLDYAFQEFDGGIAVATHDRAMIDRAIALHEEHGTPFEFQMLMGVREELQDDLAGTYDVWQYVPYGNRWLSYFSRRLMERRENLRFALRAILGG